MSLLSLTRSKQTSSSSSLSSYTTTTTATTPVRTNVSCSRLAGRVSPNSLTVSIDFDPVGDEAYRRQSSEEELRRRKRLDLTYDRIFHEPFSPVTEDGRYFTERPTTDTDEDEGEGRSAFGFPTDGESPRRRSFPAHDRRRLTCRFCRRGESHPTFATEHERMVHSVSCNRNADSPLLAYSQICEVEEEEEAVLEGIYNRRAVDLLRSRRVVLEPEEEEEEEEEDDRTHSTMQTSPNHNEPPILQSSPTRPPQKVSLRPKRSKRKRKKVKRVFSLLNVCRYTPCPSPPSWNKEKKEKRLDKTQLTICCARRPKTSDGEVGGEEGVDGSPEGGMESNRTVSTCATGATSWSAWSEERTIGSEVEEKGDGGDEENRDDGVEDGEDSDGEEELGFALAERLLITDAPPSRRDKVGGGSGGRLSHRSFPSSSLVRCYNKGYSRLGVAGEGRCGGSKPPTEAFRTVGMSVTD